MPTLDQHMKALDRAMRAGDNEAAEVIAREAQAELTGPASVMANIGAGMKSLGRGVQQVAGLAIPELAPDDATIREERRVAEAAHGGNLGLQAAQVAGEIAPTLAIPGASVTALPRALAARGVARSTLPRVAGVSAAEGAGYGALSPTVEGESRLANMGMGAALGAGVPAAVRGATHLARAPGAVTEFAGRALNVGGAPARAAEREVAEALGREAGDIAQFGGPRAGPQLFSPTSAAEFQSGALAGLEKGARTADPAAWAGRDSAINAERWSLLDTMLRDSDDLAKLKDVKRGLKPPYQDIDPQKLAPEVAILNAKLTQATLSAPYRTNPVVRHAVDEARKVFQSGPVTAEVLHGLRQSLGGGLKGSPGLSDAAVSALRSEPYVLGIVQSLDAALDSSAKTGTQGWSAWRKSYAKAAREAETAKGEMKMRSRFADEAGAATRGTTGEPILTPHALRRAREGARIPRGPGEGELRLSQGAQQAVTDILEDMDRAGIVDKVRKAATLGGSDTAHNFARLGVGGMLADLFTTGGLGAITGGALVKAVGRRNVDEAKKRIWNDILMDPDKLREFVDRAAERSRIASQRSTMRQLPYGAAGAAVPAEEN